MSCKEEINDQNNEDIYIFPVSEVTNNSNKNVLTVPYETNQFHLPTSPKDSLGNFHMKIAKQICDSLLRSFFGEGLFKKNIKFDKNLSGGNLTNRKGEIEIFHFNQKVDYKPHYYWLHYSLIYDSDTLYTLSLNKSKQKEFEISPRNSVKLGPYKQFLNGRFNIGFKEARKIALKNGIEKDMKIELESNIHIVGTGPLNYSWVATPNILIEDEPEKVIIINVMTGKVTQEQISITSIKCT